MGVQLPYIFTLKNERKAEEEKKNYRENWSSVCTHHQTLGIPVEIGRLNLLMVRGQCEDKQWLDDSPKSTSVDIIRQANSLPSFWTAWFRFALNMTHSVLCDVPVSSNPFASSLINGRVRMCDDRTNRKCLERNWNRAINGFVRTHFVVASPQSIHLHMAKSFDNLRCSISIAYTYAYACIAKFPFAFSKFFVFKFISMSRNTHTHTPLWIQCFLSVRFDGNFFLSFSLLLSKSNVLGAAGQTGLILCLFAHFVGFEMVFFFAHVRGKYSLCRPVVSNSSIVFGRVRARIKV